MTGTPNSAPVLVRPTERKRLQQKLRAKQAAAVQADSQDDAKERRDQDKQQHQQHNEIAERARRQELERLDMQAASLVQAKKEQVS